MPASWAPIRGHELKDVIVLDDEASAVRPGAVFPFPIFQGKQHVQRMARDMRLRFWNRKSRAPLPPRRAAPRVRQAWSLTLPGWATRPRPPRS
jgi:hypothetical protein